MVPVPVAALNLVMMTVVASVLRYLDDDRNLYNSFYRLVYDLRRQGNAAAVRAADERLVVNRLNRTKLSQRYGVGVGLLAAAEAKHDEQ
jgi:hypothetical protein